MAGRWSWRAALTGASLIGGLGGLVVGAAVAWVASSIRDRDTDE